MRKLDLVVAAFSAIVSVVVPFVLFVRQLWWPLLKKDVRIYTRTRLRLLILSLLLLYVYLQYVVLLPSFQAKYYLLFSRFSLLYFMPFSYGFVR